MTLKPLYLENLSAIPLENRVEALHEAYKLKFINSLIELITFAEKTLNEDYKSIINKLRIFIKKFPKYFSPWLYNVYFKLLECMDKDDASGVIQIISTLGNADESLYFIQSQRIQAGLVEDWERQVFNEEARVSFGKYTVKAYSPKAIEVELFQKAVNKALKLIATADPILIQEVQSLVSSILLVNSPANVGATSPKFFGAIYISLPHDIPEKHNDLLLIDQLVHESSHTYLNSIMAHDPLVLNNPQEQFSSPIRADLRPMLGIYHANFVLSRVIRVFKKIHGLELYEDNSFLLESINNLLIKYEIAYSTVKKHAVLTKLGTQIFESTRECALFKHSI
jgi:hypothetical protein